MGGYLHYQLSGQKRNFACVSSVNNKVDSDNSNTLTQVIKS